MNLKSITHYACPANKYGDTHHLVPRRTGRDQAELTCVYCKMTEKKLREELHND